MPINPRLSKNKFLYYNCGYPRLILQGAAVPSLLNVTYPLKVWGTCLSSWNTTPDVKGAATIKGRFLYIRLMDCINFCPCNEVQRISSRLSASGRVRRIVGWAAAAHRGLDLTNTKIGRSISLLMEYDSVCSNSSASGARECRTASAAVYVTDVISWVALEQGCSNGMPDDLRHSSLKGT